MEFSHVTLQQLPKTARSGQVAAPPAPKTPFEHQARNAAESFEAMFLAQYLNSMSVGIKTDGPFGGGHSEEMFKGVLNEEMAKYVARNNGIGLADSVYRELIKTQDVNYEQPPVPSQQK